MANICPRAILAIAHLSLLFYCTADTLTVHADESVISLDGQWHVRLDNQTKTLPVQLPGTLRDSGIGQPSGPDSKWIGGIRDNIWKQSRFEKYRTADNFKMPFWLQADLHYVGSAAYHREVTIPPSWQGQRIELFLERPHWRTEVRVDGNLVGQNDSMGTPHRFDLTDKLSAGKHKISVTIDNSIDVIDVGENAHSVSDHTQSAWHGVIGRLELRVLPIISINNIAIHPDESGNTVRLDVQIANMTDHAAMKNLRFEVFQNNICLGTLRTSLELAAGTSETHWTMALSKSVKHWDEFHPNLCRLETTLSDDTGPLQKRSENFGVRTIGTSNGQFLINGQPTFLRGTLECCVFPLTGYPPTDLEAWKRIIDVCKSHGLNHIRFHSWCPPAAAFAAADELGFYFQIECSTWPNQSVRLGADAPVDQWLYREGERIIEEYGNHPSFILLAAGNEPGGEIKRDQYLATWVDFFNQQDDRFLVTGGTGWPAIVQNQFHVLPAPRAHQWGDGLHSRLNAVPPETMTDYRNILQRFNVPVVAHEIGQWCAFPNLDEMKKYTGALKPKNYEIVSEMLDAAGLREQAHEFLMASGKLQSLIYKEEIESALRTPNNGGFQLLDLRDFPGQGTAPVGVVDPFWDPKPYLSATEFRRFCGPIVPLARMTKRVWNSDETFAADIELSHFGPASFENLRWNWRINDGDRVLATGSTSTADIARGGLRSLGRVEASLNELDTATKLVLTVSIPAADAENDWEFWVYPTDTKIAAPDNVFVTATLNEAAVSHLEAGQTVLLLADPQHVDTDVVIGFTPTFWNSVWTDGQPPNTLGVLCNPAHRVFESFPTDSHTNWQWWELISRSAPMDLDELPTSLAPIVQAIPDWFKPKRLGLSFECKVLGGKLLVCSIDLQSDFDRRPVARQMLASIYQYMDSASFDPLTTLSVTQINSLFFQPHAISAFDAVAVASSHQNNHAASQAIDGDPQTIWHTTWSPDHATPPHWLSVELARPATLNGIRCLPRNDIPRTRIVRYEISLSNDGIDWSVVTEGQWNNQPGWKTVRFEQVHSARFVKLTSLDAFRGPLTSLAELDVIVADVQPPEVEHAHGK